MQLERKSIKKPQCLRSDIFYHIGFVLCLLCWSQLQQEPRTFGGRLVGVRWTFNGCSMDVWWAFGHSTGVQWTFNGCPEGVWWTFSGRSVDIRWTFDGHSDVRRVFSGRLVDIQWVSRGWSVDIQWTFDGCLMDVQTFNRCSLDVWWTFGGRSCRGSRESPSRLSPKDKHVLVPAWLVLHKRWINSYCISINCYFAITALITPGAHWWWSVSA